MASEGDKYITSGVWLRCDKGAVPGKLTVMPKTVKLYGQDWATQLDAIPLVNIPSFGVCMVTRTPCAPLTALWTNVMEPVSVLVQKPLLDVSTCQCTVGGLIKIYFTQQAALAAGTAPPALTKEDTDAEQEAKEDAEFWGDVGKGLLIAAAVVGTAAIIIGTGGGALAVLGAAAATGAAVGGVSGAVAGGISGGAEGAVEGFFKGAAFGALGGIAVASGAGVVAGTLAAGAAVAGGASLGFLGKAYYHNPSKENGLVLVGAGAGILLGGLTAKGIGIAVGRVRTAVRNTSIRLATVEEAVALEQVRQDLRLTSRNQRSRNLAIGEGTIDGKPYRQIAISGQKPVQGTAGAKPHNEQRISTSPTQRDIEKGQGAPDRRAYDTEVKIMEDVLDQTAGNPNVKGEITITSELPICPSCHRAIASEFHKHRPNIKIKGVETRRPDIPDQLPKKR